jgi:F-type H+-transporting ATPase subunit a
MADPILHIQDSYYFEVPKLLYPYEYTRRQQFPDVWISLDPEYQEWEAERLYKELKTANAGLPSNDKTLEDWHHWVHADHANFGKPLKEFLNEKYQGCVAKAKDWQAAEVEAAKGDKEAVEKAKKLTFDDYVAHLKAEHVADEDYLPFVSWRDTHGNEYEQAVLTARNIEEWKEDEHVSDWSDAKIRAYDAHLSGKIVIPQPFGTLRNLYERESGFAISKYMLIELFVGLVLVFLFSRLAAQLQGGRPAKGKFSNLLEVFLVFIRDQIVKPALGSHDDHGHAESDDHGHGEYGHGEQGRGEYSHSVAAHAKHADPATRCLPLLWTIFFFVLGCNLMGMVPWAGAPTASFSVTFAMACVTFATVLVLGMQQFGVVGFFLNQIPGMDLPWYMAIFIKPMVLGIELLGLCIKHGVLAVRLLANMAAGHLVILGIMGVAFGVEAALHFTSPDVPGWQWYVAATIAVVASATFSVLELFVAFLQAYVFTFLSALFIGAAIHKH